MNRRRSVTAGMGIASILTLVIIMAMTIICLMCYKTAVNNLKTAEREIEYSEKYYYQKILENKH